MKSTNAGPTLSCSSLSLIVTWLSPLSLPPPFCMAAEMTSAMARDPSSGKAAVVGQVQAESQAESGRISRERET